MRRIEKRGEVNVLCDDYGCSPATKAEAEFFDEITRLRAEVALLTAQLQSGESFHAVAVRQRDAAWREVEALKATMTQQCKGFRADVEKLEAEVEALRADALKQVDCRQCKHATNRGCHSTALCERGELFEATPPWQFYDAARAAQGGET
jgi:cell division septum initiation protein DivIVA